MTLFERRVVPLWVLEHQKRKRDISTLLAFLAISPDGDIISEEKMEDCIEVFPLDYDTGSTTSTSSMMTSYFGRRVDLRLPGDSKLIKAQSRLHEAEGLTQSTKDIKLCLAVAHEIDFQIGRHYRELEYAHKPPYDWKNLIFKGAYDEKPLFCATKSLFKIRRAVEVVEERRNHCIVFLELDAHPDPEKPNITEFQIMLQIMKNRDWERKSCWQLKDKVVSMHKKVHNVVPVLIVSVYRGGQVRVLWGYFDQKLEVQHTSLQHFTSSNLADSLDDIVQWALPVVREDTTHLLAMASIAELKEDEEKEEEEEEEEEEEDGDEVQSTTGENGEIPTQQIIEQLVPPSTCKTNKERKQNEIDKKSEGVEEVDEAASQACAFLKFT